MTLMVRAWLALAVLGIVMGLLLFVSAGTVRYEQAWIYLAVFLGASTVITIDLMRKDPALLERRMRGGPTAERLPAQKIIMLFTSLGFIALLVVPGFDRRFGWSQVPDALVWAGDMLVAIGFWGIARVYRENTYAAATIGLAENQRVISTGPYGIVRHPMYASASLYFIGTPLALGSIWGFMPIVATLPFLIWRLLDEEDLLERRLPGYREYEQRVRHRLVPGVW